MKILPRKPRIVIKIDNEKTMMVGGLHLANAVSKPTVGTVEAVYPNCTEFHIGDKVFYNKHSGTGYKDDEFDKDSAEYKIISEDDILGFIDGDNS